MARAKNEYFTIGELAAKVGVTVRTLQYYDKSGLLKSALSESGRRMYGRDDIMKLQQILFLKSLGFSLEEISDRLTPQQAGQDWEAAFCRQRQIMQAQSGKIAEIIAMLDQVIGEIRNGQEISLDKLIALLELMKQDNPYKFVFHYFDDKQIRKVKDRFIDQDEDGDYMKHSRKIFARMQELYIEGADPAGEEGQELAASWWEMVNTFTGGDQDLLDTLISAGQDIDNWPPEAREIQEAIGNFLQKALGVYFENNKIRLPEMEERNNG